MVAAHATRRRVRPVNRLTVIGGRLTAAATQVVAEGSAKELNVIVAEQVQEAETSDRVGASREGEVGVVRQERLATVAELDAEVTKPATDEFTDAVA